jgi:hypothetical protein
MRTIGVECTRARCALWERVDEELFHAAWMHLEVQRASDRVLPRLSYEARKIRPQTVPLTGRREGETETYDGKHLDLIFRPRSQLVQRDFLTLALDLESSAVRSGRRHPFVRMGRIAHPRAYRDALQFPREDIEHRLSRDERRRAERNEQRIARPVIIPTYLPRALRYLDPVQRRHSRRREIIERGVDVPAVEPRDAVRLVFGRDGCLVECSVGRMFERCALEALVIVHCAVADELYLRHARDRLEVWMEDGLFGRLGLVIPMPI